MEYNQDLQQLTTHQFNNFDINNKQQDSLNIIKSYLKLKNYKYLQENKTFLICRDSKEYFSFFFLSITYILLPRQSIFLACKI